MQIQCIYSINSVYLEYKFTEFTSICFGCHELKNHGNLLPIHQKCVTLHGIRHYKNKLLMKLLKFTLSALLACCLAECDSSSIEVNENSGQEIYDNTKGNYVGNIFVNNIPQEINITISENLTVKPLPMKPILERVFTDEAQLNQALSSAQNISLSAPIIQMSVASGYIYFLMEETDLVVDVTVDGKPYKVFALMYLETLYKMDTSTLFLNMNVKELTCDGKSYDVSTNKINYFVDSAQKQK